MSRGGPVNPTIRRERIVDHIQSHLNAVDQWSSSGHYSRAAEYAAKAEALIELLEIDDCGSVGGYDLRRGQKTDRFPNHQERYRWLAGLPVTSPIEEALAPAAGWLDENQQEALSGALRQIIRQETLP